MHSLPRIVLTPRERDVVRGVVVGRTNREIAHQMSVGEQAVKNLLSAVFQKCHVRNRLELALFAVRQHLLSDDDGDEKDYRRGRT